MLEVSLYGRQYGLDRTDIPVEVDGDSGGLVTVSGLEVAVNEGRAWVYRNSASLNQTETAQCMLVTPDTDGIYYLHFLFEFDTTYSSTFQIFEASDRIGSAEAYPVALNRVISYTETAIPRFFHTITGGTTDGITLTNVTIGSGKTGGATGATPHRILKPNTKYIFRVTSNVNNNQCSMLMYLWIQKHLWSRVQGN